MHFKHTIVSPEGSQFATHAFDSQIGRQLPLTDEAGNQIGSVVVREAHVHGSGLSVEMTFEVHAPAGVVNSILGDTTGSVAQLGVHHGDLHLR